MIHIHSKCQSPGMYQEELAALGSKHAEDDSKLGM